MELQKILNLLNEASDSKFVTSFSMMNQMQIMMWEMNFSITRKY